MARSRRRDREAERRAAAELEELRPYLGLAREIRHEVSRVAADGSAPVESLVDAISRIPDQERLQVARSVFERLPAEQQWHILAEAFDDDELRAGLADEREALRRRAAVDEPRRRRAEAARAAGHLDTTALEPGDVLSLGLFLQDDVQAMIARGHATDTAPRVLTVRVEDRSDAPPGTVRVLTDAFNPGGGYFVTADYERSTWATERLESHELARVGSLAGSERAGEVEPTLFPGARLDVHRVGDDRPRVGRLHLGWALLGSVDVFSG